MHRIALRHRPILAAALALLLAAGAAPPAEARGGRDAQETIEARPAGMPLMAIVSIADQRITVYDAQGRIMRAPVSTGRAGYETPAGIYSVIQKEAEHYSNLYDDASMPFMQRITWSGIALHAGVLPGYPASHGCIRMPDDFAERLFGMTKLGTRVIVARTDVAPAAVAHPLLFRPAPAGAPAAMAEAGQPMRVGLAPAETGMSDHPTPTTSQTLRAIAASRAAAAEAATRRAEEARQASAQKSLELGRLTRVLRVSTVAKARAETQLAAAERILEGAASPEERERAEAARAKAQARLAELQAQIDAAQAEAEPKAEAAARAADAARAAEAERSAAVAAAKEAAARIAPISVFVSRQAQRLYVRQGFRPLLEREATIRDPDRPIGTHIFTALEYVGDGEEVRWSVVSMPPPRGAGAGEPSARKRPSRGEERSGEPAAADPDAARAALDRIDIPQDVVALVSEVVSPGSSLIVSDEPLSRETGKGTEFVVLMSGEPQGGVKRRRRIDPLARYDRPFGAYGRSRYHGYGGPYFRW